MQESTSTFSAALAKLRAGTAGDDLSIPSTVMPGVTTPDGPLRAARGQQGEPKLLIPIGLRDRFPEARTGSGLAVDDALLRLRGKPVRFIELTCTSTELEPVFTEVADEIVRRIGAGASAGKSTEGTLSDFRHLLIGGGSRDVTAEKAAGLLAELRLLEEMSRNHPGAVGYWTGADGQRHDFIRGNLAVEVKATLRAQKEIIEISALDQLAEPEDGALFLHHVAFEPAPEGRLSVGLAVANILRITDNPEEFREKLALIGYEDSTEEAWENYRFNLLGTGTYAVREGFPRLVPGSIAAPGVPPGVSHIKYRIDLSVASGFKLSTEAHSQLVRRFVP